MSKAKDLRTSPENTINMYELFSLFSPDKKSKYIETLFRLLKKTPNFNDHIDEVIEHVSTQFPFIPKEELKAMPKLNLLFFYRFIDSMFVASDLVSFRKFCELNERGLVAQNDLSKYNSFDEIMNSLSLAEMIADTKTLEKQIKIVHEDEEWLLLRPLTFAASKKYGSNTKWCTTQHDNPEYFLKYSSRGVLIYCINKKTGYKVASFNSLDKNEPEFSWWNQKDSRIDSLQSELPIDLILKIKDESTIKAYTNRYLLSDDEREKEDKVYNKNMLKEIAFRSGSLSQPTEQEAPVRETRRGRIARALQRETQETEEEPQSEQEHDYMVSEFLTDLDMQIDEAISSQISEEERQEINYPSPNDIRRILYGDDRSPSTD